MNLFENLQIMKDLEEAENPENIEINTLIKKVITGNSKAFQTLKKMGYEIELDDSARKQFGRESFGDVLTIRNPDTGRLIYSSFGNAYSHKNKIVANPHVLRTDRPNSNPVNANARKFDYKNFLDTPKNYNSGDQLGKNVQQFKTDKAFLKDKEHDAKRIDDARGRLSDIRKRMGK